MKKALLIFAGIISAMLFAQSCAREHVTDSQQSVCEDSENLVPISITLSLDEETKTFLGEGNKVCWEAGDKIGVCYLKGGSYYMQPFTLASGAGTQTGIFNGYVGDDYYGSYSCYYPFDAKSGSLWTRGGFVLIGLTVPSTQEYCENGFSSGLNIAMASVPYGKQNEGISMYNVGGILQLKVKGTAKIRRIELENVDGFLCGDNVRLCEDFAANPSSWGLEANGTTSSTLTLDCGESGVQLTSEGVKFNFVVPSDRLAGGFTVTLYDTEGSSMTKIAPASEQNRVGRSRMVKMPAFEYVAIPASISSICEPGIYSDPFGSISQDLSFLDDGCQCCVNGEGFFIQNWAGDYAVSYALPSEPVVGTSYNLNVSTEFGTPAVSFPSITGAKFYTKVNGLYIFVSSDQSKAYVFSTLK